MSREKFDVSHAPEPTNGPPICAEPYFPMVDQYGHPMDAPCDCERAPRWGWLFWGGWWALYVIFIVVVLVIANG